MTLFALIALLLSLIGPAASGEIPLSERQSGYEFMGPDTRTMQDDDAANPGMLWVLDGEATTTQEPTSEHWWADVLADPRARIPRQPSGFYGDSRRTAQKSHYWLADEPNPVIEVACTKCEWKAAFSRAELLAIYGGDYPLPSLLAHLAMPGCTKLKNQWDRCGVHYVDPIDQHERSSP